MKEPFRVLRQLSTATKHLMNAILRQCRTISRGKEDIPIGSACGSCDAPVHMPTTPHREPMPPSWTPSLTHSSSSSSSTCDEYLKSSCSVYNM